MHERQTALTGALLALMLLGAAPARAEKDAAMKAREGEINHWIEYYRKDRAPAAASSPGAVVEEARGKVKGKTGKVKGKR